MSATWTSRLPQFERRSIQAQQDGLRAAAYVLANQVKRNLRGGYTSGDFVTGNSINHVTIGPVSEASRGLFIRVGTNLLYNLYWELGHYNIFSRRHERVEKWRPAMMDSRSQMQAAFTRVYRRSVAAA